MRKFPIGRVAFALAAFAGFALGPNVLVAERSASASEPAAVVVDLTDQVPAKHEIGEYVGEDVMIPMRDGVKLHAQVWRPVDQDGPLPILISRSPYGFTLDYVNRLLTGSYKELADDGFIFVLQDIRGRLGSEGEFVNLRPSRTDDGGIDEATDSYDTIDWLVANLPDNNGKAGVMGVSYGGWTAAIATIEPHPALKAVSSQASPDDMFIGDDFYHNGAFRLDYAWGWVTALETDGRTMKPFDFGGTKDVFDWYLKQTDLSAMDSVHLGKEIPSWQNFVAHPSYDDFWEKQRTINNLRDRVTVPNLIVAGWYDQEDFYGPLSIYRDQEKGDVDDLNFLVVGPWNHGGWRGEGSSYGPYEFGAETGVWFREKIELPWFRHWLKDAGPLPVNEALIYQTGVNRWKESAAWPAVEGVVQRKLYLSDNGKLSFTRPFSNHDEPSVFVSDPAKPVPYRKREDIRPFLSEGSTWSTWQADDQSAFAERDDVLFWQTDPLDQDLAIEGKLDATLFASTTGTDADWVVKLVDIYPDDDTVPAALKGRQRIVSADVFRGRFREGFGRPEPIVPDAVLSYRIDLHSSAHVFRKGHRIGVQVQSTWFPLISRNPQTYVENILRARPEQFSAQTHRIYHDRLHPSAITLTVSE